MFRYTVSERKALTKGGRREIRQVATQVNHGRVNVDDLAKEIADDTSLGRGDIKSVLLHLAELTQRYISMGYSVDLGDLGTLTPRLSAETLPVGAKYTAAQIRKINVRFTPAPAFKSRLRDTSFEQVKDKDKEASASCSAPEAPEEEKSKEETPASAESSL